MELRRLQLKSLEAVSQEIDRLHRGGYQQVGKWNLSQTCEHLADWMSYPIEGYPKMPLPIQWVIGLVRLFRGRAMLEQLIANQSMPLGKPTMPQTVHEPSGDEQASVNRIQEWIRRVEDHRGEIHPSPLFGPLDRQKMIDMQIAHCCHHLRLLLPRSE